MASRWRHKKLVIFLGSGGVGKTTSAASFALHAAYSGRRVGLISIDPAQRLAQAMGLGFGHQLVPIDLPEGAKGHLEACMLDQRAVFDAMVKRFVSEAQAAKIFTNPVYQQVAENLGGALEYMAMARVAELLQNPAYDLVVVDTPPDIHALDFLSRPNILQGFMENRVMTWLIKPFYYAQQMGLRRVFRASERLMGGLAAITGTKMLEVLSEFLVLMDGVLKGFHDLGQVVSKVLISEESGFVVVSSLSSPSVRASMSLIEQLGQRGFNCDCVVMNRCMTMQGQRAVEQAQLWAQEMKEDLPLALDCLVTSYDVYIANLERFKEFLVDHCSKASLVKIEEYESFLHSYNQMQEIGEAIYADHIS